METTILVEVAREGGILRIIRTFENPRIAEEQAELLREVAPDRYFQTLTVPHIDR